MNFSVDDDLYSRLICMQKLAKDKNINVDVEFLKQISSLQLKDLYKKSCIFDSRLFPIILGKVVIKLVCSQVKDKLKKNNTFGSLVSMLNVDNLRITVTDNERAALLLKKNTTEETNVFKLVIVNVLSDLVDASKIIDMVKDLTKTDQTTTLNLLPSDVNIQKSKVETQKSITTIETVAEIHNIPSTPINSRVNTPTPTPPPLPLKQSKIFSTQFERVQNEEAKEDNVDKTNIDEKMIIVDDEKDKPNVVDKIDIVEEKDIIYEEKGKGQDGQVVEEKIDSYYQPSQHISIHEEEEENDCETKSEYNESDDNENDMDTIHYEENESHNVETNKPIIMDTPKQKINLATIDEMEGGDDDDEQEQTINNNKRKNEYSIESKNKRKKTNTSISDFFIRN